MADKKSALDRLAEQLDERDTQIEELEEKLYNIQHKYDQLHDGDEWAWRNIRNISETDNLGLPVPRLEIRYRKYDDYNVIADYGLVHRHLLGKIDFIPFGSTRIGGARSLEPEHLDLPFRDGGHILNDMWELKLPAYVVNGKKFKEIELTKDSAPNALLKKMKEAGQSL